MTHRFASESPEVASLVSVFTSLRRNEGLTAERVATSRAQPLLHLPVVMEQSARTGRDVADVAVELVRDSVRNLPDVTDRIIADAVLGLGIFSVEYQAFGLTARTVRNLALADLGVRRAALLSNWSDLHRALTEPDRGEIPVAPRDRNLRGRTEVELFERLALQLLSGLDPRQPKHATDPVVTVDANLEPQPDPSARKVIVLGGVTIDHVWRVERPPDLETSKLATHYSRSPGGKGLSQAVAVARLGFAVSLLAAVGSDSEGEEVLHHLERENIDTSMMATVPQSGTPTTGIFERPFGESAAAVWRGPLALDSSHIDHYAKELASCAAVLMTFEVPPAILHRTLDLAVSGTEQRPLVVVTPGQPYTGAGLSIGALRQIDYLVARPWELERYARSPEARYDPEQLSEGLLRQGLNALCVLGARGGTVYLSSGTSMDIPATSSVIKESSITRDAFCAALATALIEQRPLPDAIRWSAAAMAAVAEDYRKSPSPPLRARVEAMYQKYFS
ncbi:PfkB family carbohydrate kinase [Kribbella sp. NPDC051952]|uniref:PfkB family carbohydrate kinase n=1 Tax=Kribbella sp. NPDC051952 TaxID=3154851 RepID=UPI00341D5462